MKVADGIFCDLRHGVQLAVWNTSGQLTIRMVGDFLAKAMEHFRHHRDVLKTDLYTGNPYCSTAKKGRTKLGTMQLSHPRSKGEKPLTAALWTDAVISAYISVNTVEQMLDNLPAWQKAVEQQGGYLREIVGMLDKPGGDLQAMAAKLEYALAMGLEEGRYKPGEITRTT